jgi:hypothetical protein
LTTKTSGLWVWEPYSTVKGQAFVTEIEGLSSAQTLKILTGERVHVKKVPVAKTARGRFVDQLGAFTSILIVSPALRTVIEQTPGAHVQFIPLAVAGQPQLEYAIANVLDTAPAIDLDKSKVAFVAGTGVVRKIGKLAPRPAPGAWPPLFHPQEVQQIVLVTEDLRARLLAASDQPGELARLEKYRRGL